MNVFSPSRPCLATGTASTTTLLRPKHQLQTKDSLHLHLMLTFAVLAIFFLVAAFAISGRDEAAEKNSVAFARGLLLLLPSLPSLKLLQSLASLNSLPLHLLFTFLFAFSASEPLLYGASQVDPRLVCSVGSSQRLVES
jgi:hypothetical protein